MSAIPTMKGLSFFITLFTTGDAFKTYNKHNLKSLLDITTGLNTITTTVVETGTKVLPRTHQARMMAEFMIAEDSIPQKIISKLAVPAVVVGAYYEIQALDNEDYDAMVMISTKAAISVALVFVSGFWIAAAAYIALEIIWYILSGYFIDSKVEVMIEKSLFYQDGNGRRPYILESLSTGSGEYYIPRGYRDALMQAKDIQTLGGAKAVRDFIYKNYEDNKKDLHTAAMYEFSEIYRALNNFSISVKKIPNKLYDSPRTTEFNINGYLNVNKEYYNKIKDTIYLIENGDYDKVTGINKVEYIHKDNSRFDIFKSSNANDKLIDIFESFKKNISEAKFDELSKNEYAILIDSNETSAKYKLDIAHYRGQTTWKNNQVVKHLNYYLNKLIPTPLSSKDIKLLEKGI